MQLIHELRCVGVIDVDGPLISGTNAVIRVAARDDEVIHRVPCGLEGNNDSCHTDHAHTNDKMLLPPSVPISSTNYTTIKMISPADSSTHLDTECHGFHTSLQLMLNNMRRICNFKPASLTLTEHEVLQS